MMMAKFQVGDKVRVETDIYGTMPRGSEVTVRGLAGRYQRGKWLVGWDCGDLDLTFKAKELKLLAREGYAFKVGDRVTTDSAGGGYGTLTGTVTAIDPRVDTYPYDVQVDEECGYHNDSVVRGEDELKPLAAQRPPAFLEGDRVRIVKSPYMSPGHRPGDVVTVARIKRTASGCTLYLAGPSRLAFCQEELEAAPVPTRQDIMAEFATIQRENAERLTAFVDQYLHHGGSK
jgi:hypothetical protein